MKHKMPKLDPKTFRIPIWNEVLNLPGVCGLSFFLILPVRYAIIFLPVNWADGHFGKIPLCSLQCHFTIILKDF